MVFKNLFRHVLLMKVASALEGLKRNPGLACVERKWNEMGRSGLTVFLGSLWFDVTRTTVEERGRSGL